MSDVLADLKYTNTHEWIRAEGDDIVTMGITDHAQGLLGDLVYVELPDVGTEVAIEEACGVVESVKAASDIYSPLDGEIIEINEALADAPETINNDPYGDGWLVKIKVSKGMDDLLDADAYKDVLAAEDH